ncbi:MAG TPA: HEAT repeat domain-containing protein [Thermoanaerobaculia bacterium]|nr:HEAT repeat domain-containing protein [Thermoanaerobaculia bacterium]
MSSTSATLQVIEFVRALALTWKNLAAYPATHPAVTTSLTHVRRRLDELRGPAGEVVLGISNDGLVYADMKVDVAAAQKFAQALFTRGVAIVRLANDTTTQDLETFLRLLAAGTPGEQKRALWDELTAAGVMSINLQPVDYSSVKVTDRLDEQKGKERPASLWDEILQALLENRFFIARLRDVPERINSADELARLMSKYVELAAMNENSDPDATFGVRLPTKEDRENIYRFMETTIGNAISQATGMKKQHSLEQALQLLRSLADPLRGTVLRGVVEALAGDETAGALLREFASELPHDEVLDALRYLSSTHGLSKHAMMLVESLSRVESATRSEPPSEAVVNDLVDLFREEDIDRFNPDDHQALLQSVAVNIPRVPPEAISGLERLGKRNETVEPLAITHQLTAVLFDLLATVGPARDARPVLTRVEAAVRAHFTSEDFEASVVVVERLRELAKTTPNAELRAALHDTLARLTSGETITALVDMVQKATPDKLPRIQKLATALGSAARKNLLLALAEENNRSRRRRLFDFIASLGTSIVPDVASFLGDNRWFVLRNMLALLRSVQDRTSLAEVRRLAKHRDLRVRMEAIKSLLALDSTVPRSLLDDVINDPDPKVAEMAIGLVGNYAIKEGVDPLLRMIGGNDFFGAKRSLRIKAIRALGEIGEARVLPELARFFKSSFLPWPAKEERYAAWESLYNYPHEARQPLVEKGMRSSDAQVRAICEKVAFTS